MSELRALGRVISAHRKQMGLSQEDFAELAGIHRTYQSQIERGVKNVSFASLAGIAEALGTKLWVLFKEAEL